jgi:hypothetical protein
MATDSEVREGPSGVLHDRRDVSEAPLHHKGDEVNSMGELTEKGIWRRRSNGAQWLRRSTSGVGGRVSCSGDGGSSYTCQRGMREAVERGGVGGDGGDMHTPL